MPYAKNGDIELFYETWGEGSQHIVFAHGAGGNAASWWQQIPHFIDRYSLLAFDHRGFARSFCEPDEFDRKHFSGDLRAIMDTARIDSAILVCQSMGGWTGLATLLETPERVDALVLSHTPGGISNERITRLREEAGKNRAPLVSPFAHWAVAPDFHLKDPATSHLYQHISAFNARLDLSQLGQSLVDAIDPDRLADIDKPVMFITAEQDRIFPPALIERAATMVPGAVLRNLGAAGHSSYFETASAFNAAVDEIIAGLA